MRGDPDHISNAAAQLLQDAAVRELRERMEDVMKAKLRGTDLTDTEACRGVLALYQSHATYWSMLEQMVREQDQREHKETIKVV